MLSKFLVRPMHRLWMLLTRTPGWLLGLLDWAVLLAERLLVLGLAFVVLRFGFRLVFGRYSPSEGDIAAKVSENWKAVILLLIPLFYRTVRTFLEQVEEEAPEDKG